MTKREYMMQMLSPAGFVPADAHFMYAKLHNIDEEITEANSDETHLSFVKSIPLLLISVKFVMEGGSSISKASIENVKEFYNFECKRLGIENELEKANPKPKPRVRFI